MIEPAEVPSVSTDARSILLIDDDEGIREALGELLREEGYDVDTAANGLEAMRWLTEHRPSSCVLLLDLMMPVMSGGEFLGRKQTDPLVSPYPVVIITASANANGFDRTPDVKACLSKPIEMPELLAAIERCA
jgi:CheY-like chemotaxis protein